MNPETRVVVQNRCISHHGKTGTTKGSTRERMILVQLDGEKAHVPFWPDELIPVYEPGAAKALRGGR